MVGAQGIVMLFSSWKVIDRDISASQKMVMSKCFYGTASKAMDIPDLQVHLWRVGCDYAIIIGVLFFIRQSSGAVRYDAIVHGAGFCCRHASVRKSIV